MSPTFAELTVALIAAGFMFAFAVRAAPLVLAWLRHLVNPASDTPYSSHEEHPHDHR